MRNKKWDVLAHFLMGFGMGFVLAVLLAHWPAVLR